MKTKNTMTKRFPYAYNELDSLAEYLENQAAKGWELTNKTGEVLGFRRVEPQQVKISVQLVDQEAGDWQRMQYIELCEAAGWKHIFSDGTLQIFEHEDLDAEPIDSDPKVKLEIVHRRCIKQFVQFPLMLLVLSFILGGVLYSNLEYYQLLQSNTILMFLLLLFLPLLTAANTGRYLLWYHKAKRTAESGVHPKYVKPKYGKITEKCALMVSLGLIWGVNLRDVYQLGDRRVYIFDVIIMALIFLFIFVFPYVRAKRNTSRKGDLPWYISAVLVVFVITMFVGVLVIDKDAPKESYKEEITLTLSDLGIKASGDIKRTETRPGSFLLREIYGKDLTANDEHKKIWYDVFESEYNKALELVLEQRFIYIYNPEKEVQEPAFGADRVYHEGREYLLLTKNRVAAVSTSFTLTDAQKKIIGEKLLKEGL